MSIPAQEQAWARCLAGEQRLWVVDPLDGTSNFRAGFPVFSLTLALLERARANGQIKDETGYVLSDHQLYFFGVCPECQEKKAHAVH